MKKENNKRLKQKRRKPKKALKFCINYKNKIVYYKNKRIVIKKYKIYTHNFSLKY